jgi:hypothetical protein
LIDTTPAVTPPVETELSGPEVQEKMILDGARTRFGGASVERALGAPTFLIVRRVIGMLPPPPPGNPSYRPPDPTAVLFRTAGGWMTADASGFRPVKAGSGSALDALLASAEFRAPPTAVFPCPDFGAAMMLYRSPSTRKMVRTASCPNVVSRIVSAALDA